MNAFLLYLTFGNHAMSWWYRSSSPSRVRNFVAETIVAKSLPNRPRRWIGMQIGDLGSYRLGYVYVGFPYTVESSLPD